MNRFAPQTTNNFYPDLETGVGGYPAVNHRHRELDFAQPGHDVAEESIRFATEFPGLSPCGRIRERDLCDSFR